MRWTLIHPFSAQLLRVIVSTNHHEPRFGEHASQEAIAPLAALEVLRCGPHNRSDLALDGVLHRTNAPHDMAKAVGANHQQVDITLCARRAGRHRPKDECEVDSGIGQRGSQFRHDASCLQDNFAEGGVEWVAFRCTHIPAIAIAPVSQQAGTDEAIEFELDGAGRKSREARELPEVQLAIGRTKGLGEDGSAGAGCKEFQGGN